MTSWARSLGLKFGDEDGIGDLPMGKHAFRGGRGVCGWQQFVAALVMFRVEIFLSDLAETVDDVL